MALTRPRYSQIYDTDYKQSVRFATTADVGNLLTSGSITNTVDGQTVQADDRILVKNQTNPAQNGIYRVVTPGTGSDGTWIRALDADANTKITSGMTTTISEGDTNLYKTFKLATPDPILVGITELTFVDPFAASGAAGANTQLQFNTDSSIDASANLTFDKSTNTLTVNGNIQATNIIGNVKGSLYSENSTLNLTSGTSNIRIYSSNDIAFSASGTPNVAVISGANVYLTGNLIPSANVTYDLGSPTQRWREGWFSGSTIHIGSESISVDSNGKWMFTSDGATVELGKNHEFNPPSASISGNVKASHFNWSNGVSIFTTINGIVSTANTAVTGYINNNNSTKANVNNPTITGLLTADNITINNDLSVSGNLTISGGTTTLNTDNLVLTDPILFVGQDNPSDLVDLGLVSSFTRSGTYQHSGIIRDATDGIWKLFENVEPVPTTTIDFGSATYASLKTGNVMTTGNVVVGSNLRVTGALLTSAGLAGDSGQYLTSTGTGLAWTTLEISTDAISSGTSNVTATSTSVSIAANGTTVAQFYNDIAYINTPIDLDGFDVIGAGNIDCSYIHGNGSQLTGLPASYANSDVASYLPTYSGVLRVASSVTAIINGGTDGVGNIGSSTTKFNTVFAKASSAQYADLAEIYTSDRNYIPGTVVVFGGEREVTVSLTSHDPSVAGVISTNPAYIMNSDCDGVFVALQGRVPCRVLGPVSKGDRVVSSEVRGVAERLDMTKYQPGCIIGKSLESVPDGEIATIEVVVGRN